MDPTRTQLDYPALLAQHRPGDTAFGHEVAALWISHYRALTRWEPEIVEIGLGKLVYLFDRAPSSAGDALGDADDRVVGVWGRVGPPGAARDRSRQAGFIPVPARWSEADYDRGHFVAHSLGGGMDINLFPQAKDLNRGTSEGGRRWRALERHAGSADDAQIFVRPVYDGVSWTPALIDFCAVTVDRVRAERFDNRPATS